MPRRLSAIVALCLLLLVGCGKPAAEVSHQKSPEPHALSEAESERMAVSRFRNYQAKGVQFSAVVPDGNLQLSVLGFIDYRKKVGFAIVQPMTSTPGTQTVLVQWNEGKRLLWSGTYSGSYPPPQLPQAPGTLQRFGPSGSSLDSLLYVLLALGKDRPDNPLLIRQSDAKWLRSDKIGDVKVDVFQGPTSAADKSDTPARTSYWLTETGQMLRVDLFISGPALIQFNPQGYVQFPIDKRLLK